MKTIEEKSNEYADERMKDFPNEAMLWNEAKISFRNGLRDAQQWYDINIDLPDEEAQDVVLVKTDNNCFATAYYHGKNSGFIVYGDDAYCDFGSVTHWKPIELK